MTNTRANPAVRRRSLRWRPGWLVPGGLLLLLILLTVNVLTDGPLVPVDRHIHKFVHAAGNTAGLRWLKHGPASPARLLVDIGSGWIAIPVLLAVAALLAARHRNLRPLITAGTGAALLLAVVLPAKYLIKRINPGYRHFSRHLLLGEFPSGHAATATVCYLLAVLLLVRYLPPGRWRRPAVWAAAVVSFLAGAAMVWCNMHRVTDVLAGWTLGVLIIMLALRLTRPGRGTRPAGTHRAERAEPRAVAVPRIPDRDNGRPPSG